MSGALTLALAPASQAVALFGSATGLNIPQGLAFDGGGNLYVNDGSRLFKYDSSGVFTSVLAIEPSSSGLTFNPSNGNVYVSEGVQVSQVTSGGVSSIFATGFFSLRGITVDSSGNLYVADVGDNTVKKITSGGIVSTFASGFNFPQGLAFDSTGNLYVANQADVTVSKVTTGGVVSLFASGFHLPQGLAFDSSDNLYVANQSASVSKVTSGGVVSTFISDLTGFGNPQFLAVSGNNLYMSTGGSVTVESLGVAVPFEFSPAFGLAVLGSLYAGKRLVKRIKGSKVKP